MRDELLAHSSAREVLEILDNGGYVTDRQSEFEAWHRLTDRQADAEEGTRVYTPDQLKALNRRRVAGNGATQVLIVPETTQVAAYNLRDHNVVLLNFASGRRPGGGFLGGAKAQEEDLCRCSGLYRALAPMQSYYEANRAAKDETYTDHAIYSPKVPFFRVSSKAPLLPPFLASVITMPAPNAAALSGHLLDPDGTTYALRAVFARRWEYVLAIAQEYKHTNIVLGAWGCGVFGNVPEMVAETAKNAIESYKNVFERITFAIPDGRDGNYQAFKAVLESP